MKITHAFIASAVVLSALAAAPAAHAQQLDFNFAPKAQAGTPGSVLQFTAALSNPSTTDTVFLNGDTPTLNAPGLNVNDIFFSNGPTSLGPVGSGTDTYSGDFLDVTITSAAQPGTYQGTYTIVGGADSNAQDTVATADFSVTVLPAAVPEASSVVSLGLLLALGLGGVTVAARRKAL